MAATLPDIELDYNWVDLNTASGIAVGTAFDGINKGDNEAQLVESVVEPTADYSEGNIASTIQFGYANYKVEAGSIRVWARSKSKTAPTTLSIQVS
jgi:hypothetical protein